MNKLETVRLTSALTTTYCALIVVQHKTYNKTAREVFKAIILHHIKPP